ncbi:MAG TPA: hypothetical protein VJ991_14275 [Balneolales bacterium]|nr:hypothetical protein [Balneolales bacterium]
MNYSRRLALLIVFMLSFYSSSIAQIVVFPTTVIVSKSNRFGTFYVTNKSQDPQQITISYKFGYPTSDSLGNIYMQYSDSIASQKYSCAKWLKSYPSKFILPPGQKQTIRMLISPPSNIHDGVYWTRLVTNSKPQVNFPDTTKNGVVTHIVFAVDHVTSILFRNGKANPHVQILSLKTHRDQQGNMQFLAKLHRDGNAPFLGNTVLQIYDSNGKLVRTFNEPIAVYFDITKEFTLDTNKYSAGKYTARLTLNSQRDVLANHPMLKTSTITKKIAFKLK